MSSTHAVTAPVKSAATGRGGRSHALMNFLMFFATCCWAANMVAGKEALLGFPPLALVQLRVLGAGGLLGLLFLAWPNRPSLRLTPREWIYMAGVALTGATFNQLFFISGLARTTVSHTGLMVAIGPVMVLAISCALRLEALTAPKFVGMLISFSGVALLTTGATGAANEGHWTGDLILLASSAVFAFYTILLKKIADRYDALTLNVLTYGLGALLLLPFGARALFQTRWALLPARSVWAAGYMIVFASVVGYLIYAFALAELTASRVAAFNYLQPVIATALGVWLLAEKLTPRGVVGGGVILLGVYLAERERDEQRHPLP